MKSIAVVIARFQTPWLHEGHQQLLHTILERHNKVVVVLGIAPIKGSTRNPFDFYVREKMLKAYAPELVVLPLKDERFDEVWSKSLDALLDATFPGEGFVLYGSRDSFIPAYSGRFTTAELPEFGLFSSTNIRNEVSDKALSSPDFRQGINYAINALYPKVYPTVDIAVINDKGQVLLGKKPNQGQWRFPGGFVDPSDQNFEAAAKRELTEEVGLIETGPMKYLTSSKIDDWRYRNERDQIISLLFETNWIYGIPKAQDDLEQVAWIEIGQIDQLIKLNQLAPEHIVFFSAIKEPHK